MNTTNETKKNTVPVGHYTINGTSQRLNIDRGTTRKIITEHGLQPSLTVGKYEYYKLSDMVDAMLHGGERLDLQQERAILAKKQAEKLQIQIDEMNGILVSGEEIKEVWSKYVSSCRVKLLSLPTKITNSVMAAESSAKIHDILKTQIYEALTELASD